MPVSVTVNSEPALYFVHVDHIDTPRLVSDLAQKTVWRWSADRTVRRQCAECKPVCQARSINRCDFRGSTDTETRLNYNYYRDYDANLGMYKQSDPMGLRAD